MGKENPKAFICHASEDKERFVIPFARELRKNGIDAWVDEWEISLGDGLIKKIFEEGLKDAGVMIIVLSENSVNKKWVKEEIDAGFMKHMEGTCRLIPIILDDCEIPEVLKTTVWEKVDDIANYEESLNKVVSTIFGNSKKPSLGSIPKYTTLVVDAYPGLTNIDTIIFNNICEIAIKTESPFVRLEDLKNKIKNLSFPEMVIIESIDILENNHYISGQKTFGDECLRFFKIEEYSFDTYARENIHNYENLFIEILVLYINEGISRDQDIANSLGVELLIVQYVLRSLKSNRAVIISETNDGIRIVDITSVGRRFARG